MDKIEYLKQWQSKNKDKVSLYKKNYRLNNPDKHTLSSLNRKERRINSFYRHYISKVGCQDPNCLLGNKIGPLEIYEFNHIDGSRKSKRKVKSVLHGFSSYSLKKAFMEIRKCELLCANCHSLKTRKTQKVIKSKYK